MDDQYYSKKLDQYFPTRLDVLIYAHDGRGLGHASRSIGIGMALKRLYPDLRVLFVSGANMSHSLIGNANLDWIKLPSYASKIENGVSTGINGPANFYKSVLGQHRANMLKQIVESFKPRCVLVDHSPLGKREELLPALKTSKKFDSRWMLGLRAVIGNPPNFWTDKSKQIFNEYYTQIYWYGDLKIIGCDQINQIETHFGKAPVTMGYVSRLFETSKLLASVTKNHTGVVSLPWLSQKSPPFIDALISMLEHRCPEEDWTVFINKDDIAVFKDKTRHIQALDVQSVGEKYAQTLLNARIGIIYGGYNSLMDVAAAQVPAIVVMREMKDREQDEHIQKLIDRDPQTMVQVQESAVQVSGLNRAVTRLLQNSKKGPSIDIQGSESAAKAIASIIYSNQ